MLGTPGAHEGRGAGRYQLTCLSCGLDFAPRRDDRYEFGPLVVGPSIGLFVAGQARRIRPKLLMMLMHLIRRHPDSATRDEIMDACNIWRANAGVVSVMAYELRRVLGNAATIVGRENGWGWDAGGSYRLELPQ